jgi:hypothetical protein
MHRPPELASLVERVVLAAPIVVGDAVAYPLCTDVFGVDAMLLEEAVQQGKAKVTEVGEGGLVNEVQVAFAGPGCLLLIDGEEIVGAKQNRILNASFLVPPGKQVVIPVSCVEQGRWRPVSASFDAACRVLTSSARRSKLTRLTDSLTTGRGYDAGQHEVWHDVSAFLQRSSTVSSTGAYADGVAKRSSRIERDLERLAPRAGQLGLAVVRGNTLVTLDLFGSARLYSRAWRKVARGILADADDGPRDPSCAADIVQNALAAARRLQLAGNNAPGCGRTLYGTDDGFIWSALAWRDRVYLAVCASA